jgi:hypothetical protein
MIKKMQKAKGLYIYSLFIALALIVISARVYAPYFIKNQINQQIEQTPGINGQIDDISLFVFRGAYRVNGLRLFLQENKPTQINEQNAPSIDAKNIELSILWSALIRGAVVAEVDIDNARLTFIDGKESDDQLNPEATDAQNWLTLINFASPVQIDRVTVSDTELVLINAIGKQKQTSFINGVQGQITNITNSKAFSGDKIARYTLEGNLMGEAKAKLSGFINPDTAKPTFDLNLSMTKLPIEHISGLVEFYTPIDVERGDIDLAAELYADNGQVDGYVKAAIYNPDVFNWRNDIVKDKDGLFTGLIEGLTDGLANLLQSGKQKSVAANVTISGPIDDANISAWQAFLSLLRHSFVNEYEIKIDNSVNPSKDNE